MQTQHFAPRHFLPETIDLTDTAQLAPVFDKLKSALAAVTSVGELETWLAAHSEVCAALSESSSLAYIRMTCQTDDEAREKAYLHIVEVVDPVAQAAPVRAPAKALRAARVPAAPAALRRLLPQRRGAGENLPRGKRRARNRRRQAHPAVPENQRRHDRPVRGQGADARPHGARCRRSPTARGARRRGRPSPPAACRTPTSSRTSSTSCSSCGTRSRCAAGFQDFRDYTFANYERFDYTAGRLPPLPRRDRASRRPAHARAAGGAPPPARRRARCGRGTSASIPTTIRRSIPSRNRRSCWRSATTSSPSSTRASAIISRSCASRSWSISTTARARRPAATRARFPRRACPSSS